MASLALLTILGLLVFGCYDFDELQAGGTDSGTEGGAPVLDQGVKPDLLVSDQKMPPPDVGCPPGKSPCGAFVTS